MKILNFLSTGSGYKLIDDSKNIKNLERNFFKSCLAFHFSWIKSQDCKIQVKSKPTVINALNKSRYFFSSYNKLHIINIILLDVFYGVTNAFPNASIG